MLSFCVFKDININVKDFVAHEKIHNTHKCDFCDKYFESKTDLTQHMSVHGQGESIFRCKKYTKSQGD